VLWETQVGSATLYAIEDGWATRDPHEWFIGSTPEAWEGHTQHLNADGRLPVSYGCFLWDDGTRLVMIDAGFGSNAPEMPGGEAGHMPEGLNRIGVAPSDVNDVVHTHLHPDHILGDLNRDQSPFFPNAAVHTLAREEAYWRSGVDDRTGIVMSVVDPLDTAGLLRVVDRAGPVLPGISMVETFGHTPGHTSILISSGDQAVMITGDVSHSPIHTIHPEWNVGADIDKEAAAVTRARFFAEMAESGTPMAAGHYYRPGFGRIVSDTGRLRFEPLPVTVVD
jgi:glyoxylase-like metal-dependent hydrolase (beta-lactamase superfamily II)